MENILDILYDYTKNEKAIDEAFIYKIIKIMIEEKDLNNYIKSFYISKSSKSSAVMTYDLFQKKIILNVERIHIYINNILLMTDQTSFTQLENLFLINSIFLEVLLHEIEHANQQKISYLKPYDLESLLITISRHINHEFENYIDENSFKKCIHHLYNLLEDYDIFNLRTILINILFYNSSHLFQNMKSCVAIKLKYNNAAIEERLANIIANNEIRSIIEIIKEEIPNTYKVLNQCLSYYNLYGYNPTNLNYSPTLRFLDDYKKMAIIGSEKYFNEELETAIIANYNESLEKRFLLGLPITKEEYNKELKLVPKTFR